MFPIPMFPCYMFLDAYIPRSYVPRSPCSLVLCSPILICHSCSLVSIFPSTYAPRSLIFPSTYVPQAHIYRIGRPIYFHYFEFSLICTFEQSTLPVLPRPLFSLPWVVMTLLLIYPHFFSMCSAVRSDAGTVNHCTILPQASFLDVAVHAGSNFFHTTCISSFCTPCSIAKMSYLH